MNDTQKRQTYSEHAQFSGKSTSPIWTYWAAGTALLVLAVLAIVCATPAMAADQPTYQPLSCLNCAPPSAAVTGLVQTTWAPELGWHVAPGARVEGEVPITLGSQKNSKTFVRAGMMVDVGTRTGDTTPSGDSSQIGDVSAWTSVLALANVETVVGLNDDGQHQVVTSIGVEAGGQMAVNQDANVEPRVARVVAAYIRVRELQSKADVRIGLGRDEEGLPIDPVLGSDGQPQRTLQAIIHARLPIPGTSGIAWVMGRASVNLLRVPGARDVVSVGIGIDPGSIISKIAGL